MTSAGVEQKWEYRDMGTGFHKKLRLCAWAISAHIKKGRQVASLTDVDRRASEIIKSARDMFRQIDQPFDQQPSNPGETREISRRIKSLLEEVKDIVVRGSVLGTDPNFNEYLDSLIVEFTDFTPPGDKDEYEEDMSGFSRYFEELADSDTAFTPQEIGQFFLRGLSDLVDAAPTDVVHHTAEKIHERCKTEFQHIDETYTYDQINAVVDESMKELECMYLETNDTTSA